MSNVVAIVQARMTSARLPGKILMDVRPGVPMLAEVVSRVCAMKAVDAVVVAFPAGEWDAGYRRCIEVAQAAGAACWPFSFDEGKMPHESDVLSRYVLAARAYSADVVVRVTADCPLLDPVLAVDALAAASVWRKENYYVRARRAIEVCPIAALERAHRLATAAYDREHVMPWLYGPACNNTRIFLDEERPNWSVNTQADLDTVREVLARDPAATWTWADKPDAA